MVKAISSSRMPACFLVLMLLTTAGCFPVSLDVSKDGRILIPRQEGLFAADTREGTVTRLATPKGTPQFARFSPDGKSVLTVIGNTFSIVQQENGETTKLVYTSKGTWATWSPDGRHVSIAAVAAEAQEPFDEPLPELTVIRLANGKSEIIARNVGSSHVWLPDGKALLYLQAHEIEKVHDMPFYVGQLMLHNLADKRPRVLAQVLADTDLPLALSPDGQTVLLCCKGASTGGTGLPRFERLHRRQGFPGLFHLDLATSKVRRIWNNIEYAAWSPSGKQVLISSIGSNGLQHLHVADASFQARETIATDGAATTAIGSEGVRVYPSWVDEQTILYLADVATYGTKVHNLHLFTIRTDGTGRKDWQPIIDKAALDAIP